MTHHVDHLFVTADQTIQTIMEVIDAGSLGLALIVEEDDRFVRTVTDGDVRRAILSGGEIRKPISEVAGFLEVQSKSALDTSTVEERRQLMATAQIRHLPILDDAGRIVDLAVSDDLQQVDEDLQAVIMAGGFGTRLRPLTDDTPKPMLPIGGKPLMERTIRQLEQAGIRRINVTTHYLPEKITQHFGTGQDFGVDLNYVSEDRPLGTAGALRLISDQVDEPLLVMNGDILTNVDFRSLSKFHREHEAALTVGVRQYDTQVPYGVIKAENGYVKALEEKPSFSFLVNAGIYLLEPSVLPLIPLGVKYDMTDLIEDLIKEGQTVVGFPIMEYWLDIGKHDDFEQAQSDVSTVRWAA